MTIAIQHVQSALTFVIMPDTLRQVKRPVGMPDPIAHQDLGRRFPGDQRVFDWNAQNAVVRNLLDAKSIDPPLNQITIAVAIIAIVYVVWPIRVSFVGRAAEYLDIEGILVKWAIRRAYFGAITRRDKGVGWALSTDICPASVHRVEAAVIIGIHNQGSADLLQVTGTFDGLSFDFGPGQRRQQHRGEDGNDGNNHQQFDQGKATASMSPSVHWKIWNSQTVGPSEASRILRRTRRAV